MRSEPDSGGVKFNTALGWSYVMQGGQYVISTIVTFVLAAIVGPTAFGLVSMAMVYLMFIQLMVRQGMIPALVQKRDLDARHVDSAFWVVMASGVALTAASLLLSGWWSAVNRTPELEPVINVLSSVIILQSLIVVQEAVLSRRMDFKSLAVRTNSAALIGGAAGVALAVIGFGVWALVVQHIVKATVDVAVLWRLSDWRPNFRFSWNAARDLLGFSSSAAVAGFGSFFSRRADALLIGLFFGPTAVGLYRLAVRLVDVVVQVTVRAFQSVSLPELSRLQVHPQRFADRLTDMLNSTSLLAIPALGIMAGASGAIMAVLGNEWTAAAAPLSVLCVAGCVTVLTMFTGPVAMAVGKPNALLVVTWVSAALSAMSFVIAGSLLRDAAIEDQVLGVAVARVIMFSTAGLAMAVGVLVKYSSNTLGSLSRASLPGVLAGALGFVSSTLLSLIPWDGSAILRLIVVALPSIALIGGILFWLEPKARIVLSRTAKLVSRHV